MKIRKAYQGTVPENKILDTYSTSQTDTYSCNYVNNKLEWTLLGTTTGTNEINLPSSFNELLAMPQVAGNTNLNYSILIPYIHLTNSFQGYDSGYHGTGVGQSGYVRVQAKIGVAKMTDAYSNGGSVISSSNASWYYR